MRVRTDCGGPEELEVSNKESSTLPFGLFELDATGTVVHYSPPTEEKTNASSINVVGRNFFDDVIQEAQVKDLKLRFLNFMLDGNSVERFSLNFLFRQSNIKVQIVMAHLTERSENRRERFALIRLMPDTQTLAVPAFDA
jgi:photoactive yellow protein